MSLIDLIQSFKQNNKSPNLLILGLDNSGKTTLIQSLIQDKINGVESTKGANIKAIVRDGFTFNLWDIGGKSEYRQYWSSYYDDCDAFIFVVDSADNTRLDEANEIFKELLEEKKLETKPMMIFANKNDMDNVLDAEEILKKLNLNKIRDREWVLHSCSATKGTKIIEGIKWILEKLWSKQ